MNKYIDNMSDNIHEEANIWWGIHVFIMKFCLLWSSSDNDFEIFEYQMEILRDLETINKVYMVKLLGTLFLLKV